MAIKVIPEVEISKEPVWTSLLFVFSVIFFLFSLLSYFLIGYFISNTKADIAELENKLTKTEEEKALEDRVLLSEQKIIDASLLLKEHQKPTNVFELLENLTHPKVWILELKLDSEKGSLNLEGQTENFKTLSQQQELFKKEPLFKEINLQKVSLAQNGKVKFLLSILLDPQLFTR